jgi:predicted DNA-binding ribbon-helix-helix protein
MEAAVRKNFVFEGSTAKHLEEMAKKSKKSMTALVQEMIEERYKEVKVKERIEAFNAIDGSATGLLTDFSIQSVKANREI